ncbi:hypothetical protein AKJ16_DCAP03859 [Drosera capensis]
MSKADDISAKFRNVVYLIEDILISIFALEDNRSFAHDLNDCAIAKCLPHLPSTLHNCHFGCSFHDLVLAIDLYLGLRCRIRVLDQTTKFPHCCSSGVPVARY